MLTKKLDFIRIKDGRNVYIGADQYWLTNKFFAVSGCGPTTAAEILACLSVDYPEQCGALYDDAEKGFEREAFAGYITHVREYVKPGVYGLTDLDYYQRQLTAFAESRGVTLESGKIEPEWDEEKAFLETMRVIDAKLPLALLVLRNPHPDIHPYTWHWMTVIGYHRGKRVLYIATHGREHRLDFRHVWCREASCYSGMVYFWPKDASKWSMSI